MFSPSIKCLQSTQNPETFQEIQHNINILKRDPDMNTYHNQNLQDNEQQTSTTKFKNANFSEIQTTP